MNKNIHRLPRQPREGEKAVWTQWGPILVPDPDNDVERTMNMLTFVLVAIISVIVFVLFVLALA
jgi:hypothetical protein